MTDRDPINPEITGKAVREWLEAANWDEADIALEAVLVEQGVLSPDDAAYFEPQSREHGLVHIFIEEGDIVLEVTTNGEVRKAV